jgi:hypothetical protein
LKGTVIEFVQELAEYVNKNETLMIIN